MASTGPFFFSIYQGPGSVYPAGTWLGEVPPGSQSTTFTDLTPGVLYTFIVFDQSTNCYYYEPATVPIPTNSTLTLSALDVNNITCTGNADGNVSFDVSSIYATSVDINYEIFNSQSLVSTGITGSGIIAAGGSFSLTNFGTLPFGNYFVSVTETSGPNSGCGIVTAPFNITESQFPLDLNVSVDKNANCNPNSGIISAFAENGTSPYQYQVTTTPASPLANDSNWNSISTFSLDSGDYYVHTIDAYGCIVSSPVTVLPMDATPTIVASLTNICSDTDGNFEVDVTLINAGIAPYSISIDGGAFQTQTFPFTISNLFSGTHTVEINDANGCGNIESIDIAPVLVLTPNVITLPSCNNDDGELTVLTTGGSGAFTYSILPSSPSINITGNTITGVPSGIYTITTTDSVTGCTEDVEVALPEAIPPTFTLSPTPVTCFNDNSGEFDINIINYIGSYTYEVFDDSLTSITGLVTANTSTNPLTVNGLQSGTYTVTITQTANPFCTATSSVIISSPSEELLLNITETSNVTCNNNQGTITAIASGGWGNYEYELTGDATVSHILLTERL